MKYKDISLSKKLIFISIRINNKKSAFSFVELIIVITILAILSTIGYISYVGYISESRDSNRLSQISTIYNAFEGSRIKGFLPIPDNNISIYASGELIGYQGNAGEDVLNKIGYKSGGKDPDTNRFFTYYIDNKKRNVELLFFLENENGDDTTFKIPDLVQGYAIDYLSRVPTPYGDKMGILLNPLSNSPIQENINLVSTGLDIINTNDEYKAIFSDKESITGTGNNLRVIYGTTKTGIIGKTCQDYIDANSGYNLNPGDYLFTTNDGLLSKGYCTMN